MAQQPARPVNASFDGQTPKNNSQSWFMSISATRASLCVVGICAWACSSRAQWQNALQPDGPPAGQLTVARAGQPQAVIHLPDPATPQQTNAAGQLQRWLREITGATLPIQSGKPGTNSIRILTDAALGDEGYAIAAQPGQIVLCGGRTRGVLNAVYALLEEDLGCRFYTKDSLRLPATNTLVLAPVSRRYVPQLKIRDPFYACAFDPDWSLRNRTDAPSAAVPEAYGGRVDYAGMFVHTAAQLVPPDKYLKDHPEYFAQKADGTRSPNQLCATEPGVARVAIAQVRQVLRDHPQAEIVSVSKNDNTEVCLCARCKSLRETEGSDMANQLVLVNQVAEAVAKDFPAVTIDTLAYLETIQVPKTARPRTNVVIRLCNDRVGAWSHPFTAAAHSEVAKLIVAWSAVHHRLSIWDYNVNFSHYLAPMPNLEVMAANIRFWTKHHAEGVMLQGGYQGPAERDELKCWVTAKLLWNPARDEHALVQDFIWGHYGKAAPALADYEALLEQAAKDHAAALAAPPGGIRYGMDAAFLTKDFVTRAAALFGRAQQLAAGDPELLRRVDRAQLPLLYVQCVRGPEFVGEDYARVVTDFERIARREGVRCLQEGGPDFEAKLAGYKGRIPKPVSR
jgi:hypothetical protein